MRTIRKLTFYRLTYQSRSTLADKQRLQIKAIHDILHYARRRNINCGVSGILLYNQVKYFQVLEGSKAAVELIFQSILRDKRHTNVVTLQSGPAESRIFHSWSMAYKELPYGSTWFDHSIHDFPTKLLADGMNTTPGCLAEQDSKLH